MFSMWSKKMDSFNREEDEGLKLILKKRNSNSYNNNNNNNNNNNVAVIKVKPIFLFNQIVNSTTVSNSNTDHHDDHCCYLKSCHLCLKPLPLDKEIYMYRGDLGFCSVECRERQIYVDETNELEISTKRILASFRRRNHDGRCETTGLLEDYRRRRHPYSSSSHKSRVVFS